jgi:uncharacterized RDD family membrane protein YckC
LAYVAVNTSLNVNIDFELAGFERRVPAWLIDFVIRCVYLYIIFRVFDFRNFDRDDVLLVLLNLVVFLPLLFYHLMFEILTNGQSPGKMLFKVKVISLNGYKPTYMQYINRWVFRLIDTGFLTCVFFFSLTSANPYYLFFAAGNIVSLILFLTGRKEQRIGDILSNTVVIRLVSKTKIEDTIFVEVADNYVVTYPQAARLSDRDVSIIKAALKQAERKHRYDMLDNIAYRLQDGLKISTSDEAYHFLSTILRDFNYLTTR